MKICKGKTVAYRDYGEFGVVLNARNSRFLKLNPVGVNVWEFVQNHGCVELEQVVDEILSIYDVDRQRARSDVEQLVRGLGGVGIVDLREG